MKQEKELSRLRDEVLKIEQELVNASSDPKRFAQLKSEYDLKLFRIKALELEIERIRQAEEEEKRRQANEKERGQAEQLVNEGRRLSLELLEKIKEVVRLNERLLALNEQLSKLEIQIDKTGVSVGFKSLKAYEETLEKEVKGEGRQFFMWPRGFPV